MRALLDLEVLTGVGDTQACFQIYLIEFATLYDVLLKCYESQ